MLQHALSSSLYELDTHKPFGPSDIEYGVAITKVGGGGVHLLRLHLRVLIRFSLQIVETRQDPIPEIRRPPETQ